MEGEEEEEEEWYACPVPLWAVPCPYAAAELACPQQCVFAHSAATQQRVLRQYMHRRAHNKQEKKKLDNSEAQQHSLFDKEESNDKESSVVVKDSNDKDIKDISHKDHGSLRVDPLFRLRSVGVGSRSSSRIALYNTGTTALSVSAVQLDASLGISLSLFAVEGRTAVEGRVVLDVPLSVPPKGQRSVAVELRECLVVGTYRCFARFIYHSLSSPAAELVSPPVQLLCHVLLQDDVQAASLLDKNAVSFYPPSVRNCWLTPLPSKSASWSTPRFSESIAWTPLELALYINALAGPNKLVKLSTIKGCGDPLAFNALNFCKFNSPLLFLTSDSGIQTTADLSQLSSNMQVPSPRYSNINEHIRRLNQLLLLEELAMDETCKAYDEFFVEVTVKQHVASFRIAGTAEFRPQLLRGDVLLIRSPDTSYPFQIVARVLGVQQGQVTVALPSLPRPLPAKIHVRFVWNRVRFRRMFLALFDFLAFLPCRILVGDIGQASRVLTADEVRDRPVFDQRLSVEQRRAVFTMVDRRIVGEPFLLIGSAGSGKTETIVELVFQAITANAASRVLVVAPSNGAADVLALRLITRVKSLLRLNAHTRPATEVLGNGALLPYCFVNSSGMHDMPPRETLQATSVVVATCAAAGWIRESFGTDILFDLVIVDEAAQATEPETLIPLTLVQPNLGRIMLCGDCKQLGPNLRSRVAIEKGLVSLLQRLSEQGLCASVALTQNFRCHPKLMEISSHLFYNNGVTASLDPAIANRFLEYEDLCGSRFPVVFYGVNGLDEREDDSPSFWNVIESFEVARVVQKLLSCGLAISSNDIGVVSPFYRQVRLIRTVLRNRNLSSVRVASVEDYQGQQESCLIVSCVRSSAKWLRSDKAHALGLLHNNALFNVCITRAQSLLVIVGNPSLLVLDPNWRHLLALCVRHGTYHGGIPLEIPAAGHSNNNNNDIENNADADSDDSDASQQQNDAMYSLDLPWNVGL